MKSLIICFIFFSCACDVQAQLNYVLNPSFEQYSLCPPGPDNIRLATHWGQIDTVVVDPVCSPEYCNVCATWSGVGVPSGAGYYHYPRTGNGMAQNLMYFDNRISGENYQRDYTQGRLYTALTSGKTYCVTFYVTLEQVSQYAINHIGAYLDDGSIDAGQDSNGCALPQTAYTPQIVVDTIINDVLNWIKVQGRFTASGSEKFITIGNFSNIENTDTLRVHASMPNDFSYYLIDDVSVIASDAVANAGPDGLVSPGSDSAFIGTTDEGMPCTWYIVGDTVPIGYSGGLKVHPDTTTSYVVVMDLCGNVTRDTVVVHVAPAGVTPLTPKGEPAIWPNPVHNELTVTNIAGSVLHIYDMVGQQVMTLNCQKDKEVINVGNLFNGVYLVQIIDPATGTRTAKKITKE